MNANLPRGEATARAIDALCGPDYTPRSLADYVRDMSEDEFLDYLGDAIRDMPKPMGDIQEQFAQMIEERESWGAGSGSFQWAASLYMDLVIQEFEKFKATEE